MVQDVQFRFNTEEICREDSSIYFKGLQSPKVDGIFNNDQTHCRSNGSIKSKLTY